MAADQDSVSPPPPRVLIVSRRSVRKNKFVDFVGEYHLDLIVKYGAVPVIVPRVTGIDKALESFEPTHGVLLCEGEDIDPSLYNTDTMLSPEEVDEIRSTHASDTAIDKDKDSIEFRLAKLCLHRNIPYLGICRGSQVLNVACGGTLYQDIDKEVSKNLPEQQRVAHMDYDNYDEHRHVIKVLDQTPLHAWFDHSPTILVNSYHHQGVKRLAPRFVPMAFSPDGLIEGFYDPDWFDPGHGKFIMGLQFHPERMRKQECGDFDYPGCLRIYQEFVKAVTVYQKRLENAANVPTTLNPVVDQDVEKKRKIIIPSISLAKYTIDLDGYGIKSSHQFELQSGHDLFKVLSQQQDSKLTETDVGATKKISNIHLEERENVVRKIIGKMSVDQLMELMSFYHSMGQICSEVLERKLLTTIHL